MLFPSNFFYLFSRIYHHNSMEYFFVSWIMVLPAIKKKKNPTHSENWIPPLDISSVVTMHMMYIRWHCKGNLIERTLRSCHGIYVDFDKICVFYGKCCVYIDKCVFIIVKIKYVNSCRISDICNKVNFITNYTHFTTLDNILSKYI